MKAKSKGSPAAHAPRARRPDENPSGAETGVAGMGRSTRPAEPTGSRPRVVFVVPQAIANIGPRTEGLPGTVSLAEDLGPAIKLLLDYKSAAEALSLTEQALRDLVAKGYGPVVTKIRGRRMFAIVDLMDFIASHRTPQVPSDVLNSAWKGRRRRR